MANTKHRYAVDIKWAIDDNEELDDLPDTVEIPDYIFDDDIADWLSDIYGYCHDGFDIEEE